MKVISDKLLDGENSLGEFTKIMINNQKKIISFNIKIRLLKNGMMVQQDQIPQITQLKMHKNMGTLIILKD